MQRGTWPWRGIGNVRATTPHAMTLPDASCDDAGNPQSSGSRKRDPGACIAGRRILVVDDDMDACEVLRMILEAHGARVETAHSVAAALEKIKGDPPDVLVSDIGMPGQSGYQLIETVRKLKGYTARMLAVAVTAFSRPEDRRAALRAGFNSHLAKPLNAADLITVISKAGTNG